MIWQILLFIYVIIWLVSDYIRKRQFQKRLNIPLSRTPYFPIIGQGHIFVGSADKIMSTLIRIGKEINNNDGIEGMWLANRFVVGSSDKDVANLVERVCLNKSDEYKHIQEETRTGSAFANDPIWGPRRKIIAKAFPLRIVKQYVGIFSDGAKKLVMKLNDVADGKPFEMNKYIQYSTMKNVCKTTTDVDFGDEKGFLHAFASVSELMAMRSTKPWLLVDSIYKLLPIRKAIEEHVRLLRSIIRKVVETKITEKKIEDEKKFSSSSLSGLNLNGYQTFINKVLEVPGLMTESEIEDECLLLVMAGTDTTASALCYTLAMLARYPEVQKKCYEEVQNELGDFSDLTYEDLTKFKYLEAVIKEAIRLYPPIPIIARKVEKFVKLPSGHTLSPGMTFVTFIQAMHRFPKYWGPEADKFKPERFLDPNSYEANAYQPFAVGPRTCVGFQYALLSIRVSICHILKHFEILPPPEWEGKKDDEIFKLEFAIVMKDADNFKLRLTKRK